MRNINWEYYFNKCVKFTIEELSKEYEDVKMFFWRNVSRFLDGYFEEGDKKKIKEYCNRELDMGEMDDDKTDDAVYQTLFYTFTIRDLFLDSILRKSKSGICKVCKNLKDTKAPEKFSEFVILVCNGVRVFLLNKFNERYNFFHKNKEKVRSSCDSEAKMFLDNFGYDEALKICKEKGFRFKEKDIYKKSLEITNIVLDYLFEKYKADVMKAVFRLGTNNISPLCFCYNREKDYIYENISEECNGTDKNIVNMIEHISKNYDSIHTENIH